MGSKEPLLRNHTEKIESITVTENHGHTQQNLPSLRNIAASQCDTSAEQQQKGSPVWEAELAGSESLQPFLCYAGEPKVPESLLRPWAGNMG